MKLHIKMLTALLANFEVTEFKKQWYNGRVL